MLNNELEDGFIYIEPIIGKLREFEEQRSTKQLTFSDFYPQLTALFDSLLTVEYWKSFRPQFRGPINAVYGNAKQAWAYPTKDTDTVG